MAGWAVEEEFGEAGKWGGGGQLWPGANPLYPPVEESFSVGGLGSVREVGRLVPESVVCRGTGLGSRDRRQGWGLLRVPKALSVTCGSGRGLLG